MTEFKKLTSAVEEIHRGQLDLATCFGTCAHGHSSATLPLSAPALLEKMFERMRETVKALRDLYPRMHKIVLKGREKDPNRQIYNEKMCEKIDLLFTSYCEAVLGMWHCGCDCANKGQALDQGLSEENGSTSADQLDGGTAVPVLVRTGEDDEGYHRFVDHILRERIKTFPLPPVPAETIREAETQPLPSATSAQPPPPTTAPTSTSLPVRNSKEEVLQLLEHLLFTDSQSAVEVYLELEQEVPFFGRLTTAYHRHVRARAAAESWAERVASNLTDAVALEHSMREVVVADEHEAYRGIALTQRQERLALLLQQEQRREARRREEMARRVAEHQALWTQVQQWRGSTCGAEGWREKLDAAPPACVLPSPEARVRLVQRVGGTETGTGNGEKVIVITVPPSEECRRNDCHHSNSSGDYEGDDKEAAMGTLRQHLLECMRHLLVLVRQVRKSPEDPLIRTIRNNHPVFMQHYGHPSFRYLYPCTGTAVGHDEQVVSATPPPPKSARIENPVENGETPQRAEHNTSGLPNIAPVCACEVLLRFTELLLYAMGYRLHYDSWEESFKKRARVAQTALAPSRATTRSATATVFSCFETTRAGRTFVNYADLPLPESERPSVATGAVLGSAGTEAPVISDAVLPCGAPASQHQFMPQGFEPYGDRTYVLVEPDPMEQADEWMEWFDTLKDLESALQEVVWTAFPDERYRHEMRGYLWD